MTTPPPEVSQPTDAGDEATLLDRLRIVADQNIPENLQQATVPVAWMGRTSTDDAQDPSLSLPRQLENSRNALPPGFVIVAKFYDIESGRKSVERRCTGTAHEQFDIPIPRDGGIADLLAEAQRPDRRFVAVVCESIERVARTTYFSTKSNTSSNKPASHCWPPTRASTRPPCQGSTHVPHRSAGPLPP